MRSLPPHVIAAARTLAGLSQGGLASRANVTRRTIVRAEQGLPIHARNLRAVIDALEKRGVSIMVSDDDVVVRRTGDVSPSQDGQIDVEAAG